MKKHKQNRSQLGNLLWHQVEGKLVGHFGNQLRDQMWSWLGDRLKGQLLYQVWDQLWNYHYETI
jgi:hypothetical protein